MKTMMFDFDGTLADSGECGLLATQFAFKESGLAVPTKEQIDYYMGIPIEQSFQEMSNNQLDELAFSNLLAQFRQSYQTFEESSLKAFPQMEEVLQELTIQGITLFVVSSKKTNVLLRNLESLNISQYFKAWIGSDQVSHYKPHPEGILNLVEAYQIVPEQSLMVGDAIFDIQMAKAANVQSCAVTWGSHSKTQLEAEAPTFIVDRVKALLAIDFLKV